MPARTAACAHSRWHGAGRLSRGDLLVGRLDAAAGSASRRGRWSRAGLEPLVLGERAAQAARAGRLAGGGELAGGSDDAVEIEVRERRPLVLQIRTASARPSTHREVRWVSDGCPASTPPLARGSLPGCPAAPAADAAAPAAGAGTKA